MSFLNPYALFSQKLARVKRLALASLTSVLFAFNLSGCGDNNSNPANNASDNGEVIIGLTDAAGDFVHYIVDVKSITLTKANGTEVNTQALSTQVDFAQYTDMTEFFTAATIPSGRYTKATMVLDYSNANIQLEDAAGNIVPANKVMDSSGNALTELTVSVRLEGHRALTIAPGVASHLALDFDLNASNKVDLATNNVTVEPILIADLIPLKDKPYRLRGLLDGVNVATNSFAVMVRPFLHNVTAKENRFGKINVSTNANTTYEIDGVATSGSAGLEKLSLLSALSPIVVIGEMNFKTNPRVFTATEVLAGSSVPGANSDSVIGNVLKIDNGVLTVKGMVLPQGGGAAKFNIPVTVTVSAATKIRKQFEMNTEHTASEIAVGQKLRIHGTLSGAAEAPSLDATRLTMVLTHIAGTHLDIAHTGTGEVNNILTMDLARIDGRPVGEFTFTNVNPQLFTVDVETLDISAQNGKEMPMRARGFFNTIGANFTSKTLVSKPLVEFTPMGMAATTLIASWRPEGTATPFNTVTGGMSPNAPLYTHLTGGLTYPTLLTITGLSPDLGVYTIKENGTITIHTTFADWLSDLNTKLSTSLAQSYYASGNYDGSSATLATASMGIVLKPASIK